MHRVKDLPAGGDGLQLLGCKRRMAYQEQACERRSFVQSTDKLPFRARITAKLPQQLVDEMSCELRAVSLVPACLGEVFSSTCARYDV